jgi:hypothetical protein
MSLAVAFQTEVHPTRPTLLYHPARDNAVAVNRVWELLNPDQKQAAFRIIIEVGCSLIGDPTESRTGQGGCDESR